MTEIVYDSHGRMVYNPVYHPNHKKPWKTSDERYLKERYLIDGPEEVSLAPGRTVGVVMTRVYELRKKGLMPPRPVDASRTRRLSRNAPKEQRKQRIKYD